MSTAMISIPEPALGTKFWDPGVMRNALMGPVVCYLTSRHKNRLPIAVISGVVSVCAGVVFTYIHSCFDVRRKRMEHAEDVRVLTHLCEGNVTGKEEEIQRFKKAVDLALYRNPSLMKETDSQYRKMFCKSQMDQ